jgi:hypothetical protein
VPGFSVEAYLDVLFRLQGRLESGHRLAFLAWKYLIEALKPA